ncbi:hypothetical protein EOD39_14946 [Acipenser ruthenus]|uniref:DDE Tnp4 domain-containing protein n=1 Tax=Acipenser ruthenus TaxID=7906 RepID=A0A662YM07_ACIRT|nr:hypothetical protein EOD39_14946 [Acipenser ruthenus]
MGISAVKRHARGKGHLKVAGQLEREPRITHFMKEPTASAVQTTNSVEAGGSKGSSTGPAGGSKGSSTGPQASSLVSTFFASESVLEAEIRWHIGDQGVPLYLVGDAAYPLLPWLMKTYPSGHLTAVEEVFNTMLGRVWVVVEQAFGHLKGMWQILLKRFEVQHEFVPKIATSCFVLHNLRQGQNEVFRNQWLTPVRQTGRWLRQPPVSAGHQRSDKAHAVRDSLLSLF